MIFCAPKHGSIEKEIVDKDKASLTKIKNIHETSKIISYSGIDSQFYGLKHGAIKNAIVDKDRPSLTKIKNLHCTSKIISYIPNN